MFKAMVIIGMLAAVLLIPAVGSATHITDLVVSGDCDGWTAELTIHWRDGIYESDLDYAIILTNETGDEFDRFEDAVVITRGDDVDVTYSFNGLWDVFAPAGEYFVTGAFHQVSAYPLGIDEDSMELISMVDCSTVADEDISWGTVKSLYR